MSAPSPPMSLSAPLQRYSSSASHSGVVNPRSFCLAFLVVNASIGFLSFVISRRFGGDPLVLMAHIYMEFFKILVKFVIMIIGSLALFLFRVFCYAWYTELKDQKQPHGHRVKFVEFHPTEPWLLASMYSGEVVIWDSLSGSNVWTFKGSDLPVRCAKFVARKRWIAAVGDDMTLRVYDYDKQEKIIEINEAHSDYIRYVEIHPTLPLLLTCSDDMTIKCWDWESITVTSRQSFEGHAHYVMMAKFNPRYPNIFASASLDRSVKVWKLDNPQCQFTLEGHESGVNCVDYHPEEPYIFSGADGGTVKIWNYQTKTLVHTLAGHSHNVTSAMFHPHLPLIFSAGEDGIVKLWRQDMVTYREEATLDYGAGRPWTLAVAGSEEGSKLAVGFDEGCTIVDLGPDCSLESESMEEIKGRSLWLGGEGGCDGDDDVESNIHEGGSSVLLLQDAVAAVPCDSPQACST